MPELVLENLGSLITIAGTNSCLGDLFDAKEHGVWDPTHGRVAVPPEHVTAHNQALSQAMIDGLINCEIGQGGYFYCDTASKPLKVKTFIGQVVSEAVTIHGRSITFHKDGNMYRGRLGDSDAFNFKRIA